MSTTNKFSHLVQFMLALILVTLTTWAPVQAVEDVKPFVLASKTTGGNTASIVSDSRKKLESAGFEIIGQYSPYADAEIIVFTNDFLRKTATQSERGGYGAAMRASITSNEGVIELVYTNPVYWANAYRMNNNLDTITAKLKSTLGFEQQFGTGDNTYSTSDMRKYHYTFMMEYFDDPSLFTSYDSHQQAVDAVSANLSRQVSSSTEVYRLSLGRDSEGKEMTLFGVGLTGQDEKDCSSDQYIMGRIDKSSPRHTAHLPYELLVYGNWVQALYARFRIAISWPHLPMMSSDTGATFFSIMCAPRAIEKALTLVAGGSLEKAPIGDK
jgi:hypothetical protein